MQKIIVRKTIGKVGVIDIGSNSVRMVVYDGLKRSPLPVFNEKVLCGLAKGMADTGALNPAGALSAQKAIRRFSLLARNMGVKNLYALATSAVRDAKDGDRFRKQIEKDNGIKITIVSGEEEARFSTLGIISSIHQSEGIVGDLGGGSLELSYVKHHVKGLQTGGFQSYPIGPLRFKNKGWDRKNATEFIDGYLDRAKNLETYKGGNFYAVGGGFRALAKIHIQRHKYPIKVLHNYMTDTASLSKTIDYILGLSASQLKTLHLVSPNRLETLAFTALIASRIISYFKCKNFIFSVHGLREGFLFDQLDKNIQQQDPLVASCSDMIEHLSTDSYGEWTALGYELFEWMNPLFSKETSNLARLRLAACILSRMAWYEHTEYRAEMAFRLILDGEITGMDHRERVFLATAVYHRYKTSAEKDVTAKAQALINRDIIYRAYIIGLALRLGISLCGGAPQVLKHINLKLQSGKLVLTSNNKHADLIGESVERRLKKLAEALGVDVVIKKA